jgi:PAT family beta-lactamase induction signal transducer AmpG
MNASDPRPARWVPTLYFAEGLPFFLINVVSVLMYSDMGLNRTQIALLTSSLVLPWSLRPLWSPFLEMVGSKKRIIVATQFFAGIGLAGVALCIPLDALRIEDGETVRATLALLWLLAFNAATHDMAADGLYIGALDERRQARFVGLQAGFFAVGRIFAQGAIVSAAGFFGKRLGVGPGWMVAIALAGAVMLLVAAYHFAALPHEERAPAAPATGAGLLDVLRAFLRKRNIGWAIAFVLFYRVDPCGRRSPAWARRAPRGCRPSWSRAGRGSRGRSRRRSRGC